MESEKLSLSLLQGGLGWQGYGWEARGWLCLQHIHTHKQKHSQSVEITAVHVVWHIQTCLHKPTHKTQLSTAAQCLLCVWPWDIAWWTCMINVLTNVPTSTPASICSPNDASLPAVLSQFFYLWRGVELMWDDQKAPRSHRESPWFVCVGVCVFAFGVAGMFTSQILGLSECGRAYIPVFRFVKVLVWFCVCVHA